MQRTVGYLFPSGATYTYLPIEDFWISGPNGRHLCMVSEVADPSIAQLSHAQLIRDVFTGLDHKAAQRIALQVAQILALLHSAPVKGAHGDLTSAKSYSSFRILITYLLKT